MPAYSTINIVFVEMSIRNMEKLLEMNAIVLVMVTINSSVVAAGEILFLRLEFLKSILNSQILYRRSSSLT